MNLATVDPDAPKHFKDLQQFYVAFYDMLENIPDFADLDAHFAFFEPVRTYHPEGAIVSAIRKRTPQGNILMGDYFIVAAPELELMWRIAVTDLEMGDIVNDSTFAMHPDPFGEITRTYRGKYFESFVSDYEEPMEEDDVDLDDYFAARRIPANA